MPRGALKFTFEGGIDVALRWLGDRVELSVEDTGTGIPEEALPRVFERFYRVEGARGRSHEGTGIGLALVQELVKLHGGQVEVKSALGKGTTFTVSLLAGSAHLPREHVGPARTLHSIGAGSFLAEVSQWNGSDAASASVPLAPASAALAQPATVQQARILVADDNVDMRSYLSRLLSAHWAVEAVEDGQKALLAARANPPDLVLSDVMMPAMGGLELVQALRANESTRAVPILLLSARAGEEATIQGLESGADEYVVKPQCERIARARQGPARGLAASSGRRAHRRTACRHRRAPRHRGRERDALARRDPGHRQPRPAQPLDGDRHRRGSSAQVSRQ